MHRRRATRNRHLRLVGRYQPNIDPETDVEMEPESLPALPEPPQDQTAHLAPLQAEVIALDSQTPSSQRTDLTMKLMEIFADNHSRPFGELLMNTILDTIAKNGVDVPGDIASLRSQCAIEETSASIDEMRVAACGFCQLVDAKSGDGNFTTCACVRVCVCVLV